MKSKLIDFLFMSKKRIGFIFLVFGLIFILSGCLPSPTSSPSEEAVSFEEVVDENFAEDVEEEPEFLPGEIEDDENGQGGLPLIGELNFDDSVPSFENEEEEEIFSNTRTFNMIVQKFEFIPTIIRVKKGNKVIINITSKDEEHGFVIDDYNINKAIPSGQSVSILFIADKVGSFEFYSNIYAGAGTSTMRGTLIVEN